MSNYGATLGGCLLATHVGSFLDVVGACMKPIWVLQGLDALFIPHLINVFCITWELMGYNCFL